MARSYARTARRIVDFTKMKFRNRGIESILKKQPELHNEVICFLNNPPEDGEGLIFVQMLNIFPKMFNVVKDVNSSLEMFDYEQMDSEDINMLFAMFSDHFSGESVVSDFRRLNNEDVVRMNAFVKKLKDKNVNKIIPVAAIVEQNKVALQHATALKVGKTTIDLVAGLVGPKLPMMVRGYADHPIFKVVLANILVTGAKQVRPNDKRIEVLSSAVMDASYVELMDILPVDELIDNLLNRVAIDNLMGTE